MIDILIGTVVVLGWNGYLFAKMKQNDWNDIDSGDPSDSQRIVGDTPEEH